MVDYCYAGGKRQKESGDKHVFIWMHYLTDLINSFINTYQYYEHSCVCISRVEKGIASQDRRRYDRSAQTNESRGRCDYSRGYRRYCA
jgi:hypothetical protein